MRRMEGNSRLPALAVAALLIAAPLGLLGQAATETPVALEPAGKSVTASSPEPTPEEVGDALMTHQRYQAAIEAYKQAPLDSAEIWNKMGIAYQMMFNLQGASRCYRTSLKLKPKDAHVLNNMGTVYDSLKDYRSAEHMYRKALKYNPGSAMVLKNLGTNLLAQHKFKKGWEAYQSALAFDPKIFQDTSGPRTQNLANAQERGAMNYYMARGCVRTGQTDRAIDYLRMALNEGFTTPKKIMADVEFASLRGIPAFQQLLNEQQTQ